jgi:hypothetical protein
MPEHFWGVSAISKRMAVEANLLTEGAWNNELEATLDSCGRGVLVCLGAVCVQCSSSNGGGGSDSGTSGDGTTGATDGGVRGDGASSDSSSSSDGHASTSDGHASSSDATSDSSSIGEGGAGTDANPCPNPQTTFGFTGQGDSNPNFTSGVGALGTNLMYIFSGYIGP